MSATIAAPAVGPLTEALRARCTEVWEGTAPDDVQQRARLCFLDLVGVTIAASRTPLARTLAQLSNLGGGGATVIGLGRTDDPARAALINGAVGHVLDYDDTDPNSRNHPTVPVAPAALALAQLGDLPGGQLQRAIMVGIEAEGMLASAISAELYGNGWHTTATLGAIGAAAACAALLGLDEDRWQSAIGLAAIQAAGAKSAFGTMGKPLQAGFAARTGLEAALFAQAGISGPRNEIDGLAGLAARVAGGPREREVPSAEPWHLRDVLMKFEASCFGTHAPIKALRSLVQSGLGADQVESVVATISTTNLALVDRPRPDNGLGMKFSVQATGALTLLGIDTGDPRTFAEENFDDSLWGPLSDKITVLSDPANAVVEGYVVVRTTDGRTLRATCDVGKPEIDVAGLQERVIAKFRAITDSAITAAEQQLLLEQILELDRLDSASHLALPVGGR